MYYVVRRLCTVAVRLHGCDLLLNCSTTEVRQATRYLPVCYNTLLTATTLALFYKGLHGLSAIPCDSLRRPVRNSRHSDSDAFTILSSRLDCYKYSFFPRTISEWNKLSQDVRSKSSIVFFFRSALLKTPVPVENNFLSHGTAAVTDVAMSIAGYLPKNPKNL